MQKNLLRVQTLVFILFSISSVIIFIYALGFMTDFKTLFQQFGGAGDFHSDVLQPFNQEIFSASLITIIGFAVLFVLELPKKVSDYFGLLFVWGIGLYNIITGLKFASAMAGLKEEFINLDFTQLLLPVGTEYIARTRTFELGENIYYSIVVMSIILILIASFNTIYFLLKVKGGKASE